MGDLSETGEKKSKNNFKIFNIGVPNNFIISCALLDMN